MKKILRSILTVALVSLVMVVPGIALADDTDVTGQVAATPTITSITPNNGDINTAPTVIILGTDFVDGETTINVAGTGVTPGAVTFTSSSNISTTFTIAADASAEAKSCNVTVAGKTSNSLDFTVNSSFTVTAPSTVSLGLMIAGATNSGNSTTLGTVITNAVSWQVTADDAKSDNTGFMVNGGLITLTNKFQISTDNSTFANADAGITYGSDPVSLPFYVKQTVDQSDQGGSYTIAITFTGAIL